MALTKVKSEQLDAAQTSITSVGTLTGLTVSGDLTVDTTTFKVDSSNNRVGIGTTSPAEVLQVAGGIKTTGGFLANTANSVGISYSSGFGHFISWGADGSTKGAYKFTGSASDGSPTADYMVIDSTGNVGIGTTNPADALHILDTSGHAYASVARSTQSQGEVGLRLRGGTSGNDWYIYQKPSNNNLNFYNTSDRMTIDSSGNVGIGTTPSGVLSSGYVLRLNGGTQTFLAFNNTTHTTQATGGFAIGHDASSSYIIQRENQPLDFYTNDVFSMRILANGTFLVGKIADDNSAGFKTNTSSTYMVSSTATPTFINRLSSAGDLIEFRKDSATKGRIGTDGSDIYIGSDDCNLFFFTNAVLPVNSVGGGRDNAINLGASTTRFVDLYLANVMYSGSARIATTTANSGGKIQVKTFSGGVFQIFQNSSGSTIGYIGNVNNSSTIYSTSSDERLKENITDSADAGSRIDAIQVRQFDWKADSSHEDYGMIAQELKTVAPEAVFEPENEEDMKGIDYSKLVPMLVKEIQSLRKRVLELEK